MVANIGLEYNSTNFKLSERAEKVKIRKSFKKYSTIYQIANIHNPEVKVKFFNEENRILGVICVRLKIIM